MDRPEIILAPGPTPIPPEVLLAQGSPLVYHRGPGFGNIMRDVTDAAEGALPHRVGRRAADDLERHGRARVGDRELLLARATRCSCPLAGFFSERFKKLAETFGLTVRTVDYEWGTKHPSRRRRGGARRAPGEGRAAHPVRDLDRRDPADRAAREGRERRRRPGDRRRGVLARRGAVRVRRLGDRRGGRRQPEGAVRLARHRVRRDQRARVGGLAHRDEPALLLRLGHLQAVRRPAAPREPVDARDQRDAGAAGRARRCTSRTGSRPRWSATGCCRAP